MSESEETEGKGVITVLLTSGLLVLIGFATLAVLMYFSWQLGWSLGTTESDRWALGSLHVSAEMASAGLVGWSAVIAALGGWAWRSRSFIAFVCAIVFALVSVLNTYGFMSPRIAAVAGHEGVIEAQKSNAEWLKQMSVNPEVAQAVGVAAAECATGRGPKCLAAEARAKFMAGQQGHMGEKLEQQFKKLEKTASESPDSHALAVASITGLSVAAAQKLLIIIMAGFGQCVKFSCTFFGFKGLAAFLHRRRRQQKSVEATTPGNKTEGGGNTGNDDNKNSNIIPLHQPETSTPAIRAESQSVAVTASPSVEPARPATPQRSVTPVASAPWSADDVDAYLRQRPLLAKPLPWRQLGVETGWNWNTLYKRGQRLTGADKGKRRVLGQHRQQHRQEHRNAYPH